jgi:hypothetical protein
MAPASRAAASAAVETRTSANERHHPSTDAPSPEDDGTDDSACRTAARGDAASRAADSSDRGRRVMRSYSLLRLLERATEADFPVVNANVVTAFGVAANPGLVGDRRSVASVVAERKQGSTSALLTCGELCSGQGCISGEVRVAGVAFRGPSEHWLAERQPSGRRRPVPWILALEHCLEVEDVREVVS